MKEIPFSRASLRSFVSYGDGIDGSSIKSSCVEVVFISPMLSSFSSPAMLEAIKQTDVSRPATSQLLDNCTMALESLPLRHSSVPGGFNTALAAVTASLEACSKGMARFQDCEDAWTAEPATTQPNSTIRSDRDKAQGKSPEIEGSDVNWSAPPRTMLILGLGSA